MDKYNGKCVVFYKPDEKIGWKAVKVMGNVKEVEKKCLENEDCSTWKESRILSANFLDFIHEDFVEFNEEAFDVHWSTAWVYRPELDRWFFDDENDEIPIPETACEITDELEIEAFFDDFWHDEDDFEELEKYPNERPVATIVFKTPQQKYVSNPIMYVNRVKLRNFLRNMQRGNYAYYYQFDYAYDKFFAWNYGDKIRFSIQNYDSYKKPKTVFDVIVDKNLLIDSLYEQIGIMEREIPKIKKDPAHYPFVHYEYELKNDEE